MGRILKVNGAFVLILASALLWTNIAWAAPGTRLNKELDSTTLEELPIIEYDPLAYGQITYDGILPPIFHVAAAGENRTCAECGYENKADVNFCIKCGAHLKEEAPGGKIYCHQCGAVSTEGSKFCTACGYALEEIKTGVGAGSTAPPRRIGIYFTGGLASYGGTALEAENVRVEGEMGNSWAAGTGLAITLWTRPGAGQLSLPGK